MEENIKKILEQTKSIAVIGLSVDSSKASYIVAQYLQENGYKIYPIYPKFKEVLGEKIYRNLEDINEKIDLVLMFRKGSFATNLLPIIIQKGIKNFWLQLGIFNDEVQEKCQKLGINFVQDRCIMRELPLYKN
ncbi:CoA-binding protein [Campylobacter taeniopygiae]|uniref:CoA-binding protein n=1 Tax=Campylobacter taeniopygiae TaxID=2510188 RepID=A0ABY2TJ91_9BACT|nr:CoA-binding protein [Campylobacter taeniopygiae]TKX34169.1 CoA-binding protein [Campylobacter taeniopygiae]